MKKPLLVLLLVSALVSGCSTVKVVPAGSNDASSSVYINRAVYQTPFTRFIDCDVKPSVTYGCAPEYPAKLRKANIAGEAIVEFLVGVDGRAKEIQVTKASDPAFADAAAKCIAKWRFTPARKDGKVVVTPLLQPLKFRLSGE